jgi:hypothetical protein
VRRKFVRQGFTVDGPVRPSGSIQCPTSHSHIKTYIHVYTMAMFDVSEQKIENANTTPRSPLFIQLNDDMHKTYKIRALM